jgi:hypothetical protein
MARKFLTNLDMSGNQLLNATFEKLAEAPTTGNFEGRMYYNTSDDLIYVNNGSGWTAVGSVTSIQGTENEVVVSASIGSVTLSLPETINADTTGNAATATALETARTISLGGDLSGSASFDGTQNITINATVDSQSSVDSLANADGNLVVSASVGAVTVDLASSITADVTGDLTGNADTATALETARTIALGGDLSGSASFDGSASITITAEIQPDSVALGTDTTGSYVESVSASDGISATGTGEGASVSLTNTDKGSSQNIFKTVSGDSGSITAGSNSASVTIAGGTGITTSASAGTVTIDNDGVLSVSGTANQISASTVDGDVTLTLPSSVIFPGTVTLNADPTQALEAATKQYVDEIAEGLKVKPAVEIATTANLVATYSNGTAGVGATLTATSNGAFPEIDGVTLTSITPGSNGVLVKNQSNPAHNGRYNLTQIGDGSNPWILTRCGLCDQSSEIPGMYVFVKDGTAGEGTGWVAVVDDPLTFVVGTGYIDFIQFSGAGTYTAGNGLTLSGTQFNINTGVTADLSTAQTLTNKTLTSPVVSGLYLSDNEIVIEGDPDTNETRLVFTNPTADRTITFKDATGTVAFTSDIPTTTDGLTEGSTNLYFTDERAEDAIGAILSDTATVDFTYTDNGASAGSISADVILKASNSYLTSASGLAVDITTLEAKLVADSFTKKASASVGNGTNTSFAVNHNLGTEDVIVQVFDNSTHDTVEVDVVRTNTNTVTVSFSVAPASNAYRVVVIG